MKKRLRIIAVFLVSVLMGIFLSACQKDTSNQKEKVYQATEAPKKEAIKITEDTRIICWGDSLTSGSGKIVPYPEVLAQLTGLEVVNYGVGGDPAERIACRQGAYPLYVEPVTIPEGVIPTRVFITNQDGNIEDILWQGNGGVNPCSIQGVSGNLTYDFDLGIFTFLREKAGNEVVVSDKIRLELASFKNKKSNDILIIFSGTNNIPSTANIDSVIKAQRAMLRHDNSERYVIIGMTAKSYMPEIEAVNEIMAAEYGEHFLDVRKYLLENGLEDAGVTPTEQDKTDILMGEIPSSLRTDIVHGTNEFYRIMAEQVYQRLIKLGYIEN